MSDLEALYSFLNKPVDNDMISLLVATTTSIIGVPSSQDSNFGYLTPPSSPVDDHPKSHIPSLSHFISRLIHHSHVQTPTLMTSLIYLNKLKMAIPPNSQGIETTHHRIFLGSLILAAKFTNDSSPMNKHWTKYTDGLLSASEVNALERELIAFIGWDNLTFTNKDLIKSLQYFLVPIKETLKLKTNSLIQSRYPMNIPDDSYIIRDVEVSEPVSISPSMPSLMSSSSVSTMSSYMSTPSNSTTNLNSNLNPISRSSKDENLNIKLKPLRLSSNLKYSKSSLKLTGSVNGGIPLNDLSNSNNIMSSY